MKKLSAILAFLVIGMQSALALTVQVLGRDTPVKLDGPHFVKYEIQQGGAIKVIYYDASNEYVVYQRRIIYMHRCEVPEDVIADWVANDRPDSFYQRRIDDRYHCHSRNTPSY